MRRNTATTDKCWLFLFLLLLMGSNHAFLTPVHQPHRHHLTLHATSNQDLFTKTYLPQGRLREAVRLLQDDSSLLDPSDRTVWRAIFDAVRIRTTEADEDAQPVPQQQQQQQSVSFPPASPARQEMTDLYHVLQSQQFLRLYGAVPAPLLSRASGTHQLPPTVLEDILGLPMKSLTPSPTSSVLLAGGVVAIAESLLAAQLGVSLNALVLVTLAMAVIDRLALNGAGLESFIKLFNPGVQDRIVRHEAGHFLAAYLMGCPVEGIVLSAWAARQDSRFGSRQVTAGTSFYDPDLAQAVNEKGQLTRSVIDRYSIIVMAGIAAEADCYGRADGGAGDELALVAFLSPLNQARQSGGNSLWDADGIRNQARWAAMQAVLMLREYKPAYGALVKVLLEENAPSLGDCIYAIENAAREHNLRPLSKPFRYLIEEDGQVAWRLDAPAVDSPPLTSIETPDRSLASLEMETSERLQKLNAELDRRIKKT